MKSTDRSDYKKFLQNLLNARKHSGLDQVEVAMRLGKTQSYISKCETGSRRLDVVEASRFAKLYKITLDELVA